MGGMLAGNCQALRDSERTFVVALRSGFRFVSIRTTLLEKRIAFLYHFHPVIKFWARTAGFLPALLHLSFEGCIHAL